MPQENAFHNLLFLLEKRRKRGEGHKQNKQERSERRREESARAEGGGGTGDTRRAGVGEACAVQSSDRRVGRVMEIHGGRKWSADVVGCI